MKTIRLLFIACLLLPLALGACKKEEAPAAVDAPMAKPTTNDDAAWGAYLTDVVRRNMEEGAANPYVYVLPAPDTADFQGYYDRQLEKAQTDISRGILEGNLLAFGSPTSAKTADLTIAAFSKAQPGSMNSTFTPFIEPG